MGNHDLAADFLRFFGRDSSFYALQRGGWSIVVLDSTRSPREQAAYLGSLSLLPCSVALWHHPHWTSRRLEGVSPFRTELWDVAVSAGVDVVLNGHNHVYERFNEQGVRQFTVGTGGKELYDFPDSAPRVGVQLQREPRSALLALVSGLVRVGVHVRRSRDYRWRPRGLHLNASSIPPASCHTPAARRIPSTRFPTEPLGSSEE